MAREDERNQKSDESKTILEAINKKLETFTAGGIIGEIRKINNELGKLGSTMGELPSIISEFKKIGDFVTSGAISQADQLYKAEYEAPKAEIKSMAQSYAEQGISLGQKDVQNMFKVSSEVHQRRWSAGRFVEEQLARPGAKAGVISEAGMDVAKEQQKMITTSQQIFAGDFGTQVGRRALERRFAEPDDKTSSLDHSQFLAERQKEIMKNKRLNES